MARLKREEHRKKLLQELSGMTIVFFGEGDGHGHSHFSHWLLLFFLAPSLTQRYLNEQYVESLCDLAPMMWRGTPTSEILCCIDKEEKEEVYSSTHNEVLWYLDIRACVDDNIIRNSNSTSSRVHSSECEICLKTSIPQNKLVLYSIDVKGLALGAGRQHLYSMQHFLEFYRPKQEWEFLLCIACADVLCINHVALTVQWVYGSNHQHRIFLRRRLAVGNGGKRAYFCDAALECV